MDSVLRDPDLFLECQVKCNPSCREVIYKVTKKVTEIDKDTRITLSMSRFRVEWLSAVSLLKILYVFFSDKSFSASQITSDLYQRLVRLLYTSDPNYEMPMNLRDHEIAGFDEIGFDEIANVALVSIEVAADPVMHVSRERKASFTGVQ